MTEKTKTTRISFPKSEGRYEKCGREFLTKRFDNYGQIILGFIPFILGIFIGLMLGPFITGFRSGCEITDKMWRPDE